VLTAAAPPLAGLARRPPALARGHKARPL
jgi:hypothetical protein